MAIAVSDGSCARARRALSLVLDIDADVAEIEVFAAHVGNPRRKEQR